MILVEVHVSAEGDMFSALRSPLETDSRLFNRLMGVLSVLEKLKSRSQWVVYSNHSVSDSRGSPASK